MNYSSVFNNDTNLNGSSINIKPKSLHKSLLSNSENDIPKIYIFIGIFIMFFIIIINIFLVMRHCCRKKKKTGGKKNSIGSTTAFIKNEISKISKKKTGFFKLQDNSNISNVKIPENNNNIFNEMKEQNLNNKENICSILNFPLTEKSSVKHSKEKSKEKIIDSFRTLENSSKPNLYDSFNGNNISPVKK